MDLSTQCGFLAERSTASMMSRNDCAALLGFTLSLATRVAMTPVIRMAHDVVLVALD